MRKDNNCYQGKYLDELIVNSLRIWNMYNPVTPFEIKQRKNIIFI